MNRKSILPSVTTIVLFFLINFGLWEVLVANGMSNAWASFTVYLVLFVLVIVIWNKTLLSEWSRFKSEIKSWKNFFIELIVYLVIAIVFAYLFQYLINGSLTTDNTQEVGKMTDIIPPILTATMLSVFTPFIEELTFRQSLIGVIRKNNKIAIYIMMIISVITHFEHCYTTCQNIYFHNYFCGHSSAYIFIDFAKSCIYM